MDRIVFIYCAHCGRPIHVGEFYRLYQSNAYCGDRCVSESIGAEERKA